MNNKTAFSRLKHYLDKVIDLTFSETKTLTGCDPKVVSFDWTKITKKGVKSDIIRIHRPEGSDKKTFSFAVQKKDGEEVLLAIKKTEFPRKQSKKPQFDVSVPCSEAQFKVLLKDFVAKLESGEYWEVALGAAFFEEKFDSSGYYNEVRANFAAKFKGEIQVANANYDIVDTLPQEMEALREKGVAALHRTAEYELVQKLEVELAEARRKLNDKSRKISANVGYTAKKKQKDAIDNELRFSELPNQIGEFMEGILPPAAHQLIDEFGLERILGKKGFNS